VSNDGKIEQAGIVLLGRVTGALLAIIVVIFGFGSMRDEAPSDATPSQTSSP
jgi:hypothetical protein